MNLLRLRRWALITVFLSLLGLQAPQLHAAPGFEDTIAQRAQACTLCHGKEGRAAADGYYPRLAGKPHGYLYKQLLNFRDGRRHYGPMSELIEPLTAAPKRYSRFIQRHQLLPRLRFRTDRRRQERPAGW